MAARAIDLYKDDVRTVSASDLYSAIEAFTRVSAPPADRTQEGYQLDFEEQWNARALKLSRAGCSQPPPATPRSPARAVSSGQAGAVAGLTSTYIVCTMWAWNSTGTPGT